VSRHLDHKQNGATSDGPTIPVKVAWKENGEGHEYARDVTNLLVSVGKVTITITPDQLVLNETGEPQPANDWRRMSKNRLTISLGE
jgi:hypothetical protein